MVKFSIRFKCLGGPRKKCTQRGWTQPPPETTNEQTLYACTEDNTILYIIMASEGSSNIAARLRLRLAECWGSYTVTSLIEQKKQCCHYTKASSDQIQNTDAEYGIFSITHLLLRLTSWGSWRPPRRTILHQQIGQYLLPLAAANFSVDDPAGASSQQREECQCGLLLAVVVPAKQVCSPIGDRCDQIMNDVCQQ